MEIVTLLIVFGALIFISAYKPSGKSDDPSIENIQDWIKQAPKNTGEDTQTLRLRQQMSEYMTRINTEDPLYVAAQNRINEALSGPIRASNAELQAATLDAAQKLALSKALADAQNAMIKMPTLPNYTAPKIVTPESINATIMPGTTQSSTLAWNRYIANLK